MDILYVCIPLTSYACAMSFIHTFCGHVFQASQQSGKYINVYGTYLHLIHATSVLRHKKNTRGMHKKTRDITHE